MGSKIRKIDNIIISCITPTFNRANLLPYAIESTLSQTYPNWEMIIIDDGSEDNTEQLVLEFCRKDKRIRYYKNPGKGANAARNFGIRQSRGTYIVFLDDDDEHLPHRFESQLSAIQKARAGFLLSGYQIINDVGEILSIHNRILPGHGAGIGIRWMISKELLFRSGLFDEDMPSMQEAELSYRTAQIETFAFHPDIVVSARQTVNSISKGMNGIEGKKMLIGKHENKMHNIEAAWWYYVIAKDYYRFGYEKDALKYLEKAAKKDDRTIYTVAYYIYRIFYKIGILKRINLKILGILEAYKYPILVEHVVIN